jgi:hypothetical protein
VAFDPGSIRLDAIRALVNPSRKLADSMSHDKAVIEKRINEVILEVKHFDAS